MSDQFPTSSENDPQGPNKTRLLLVLGVIVAIGLLAFLFLHSSPKQTPPSAAAQPQQPSMGVEERAYAASVGVDHLEISRAENFLHQEVTTISGEITNGGGRPLDNVELTLEFFDEQNQIAQRETRNLFGPPGPPIAPSDHREFEISFEHISNAWNLRPPVVKVTALQFAPAK
jgi:hypothetical protein